MWIVKQKFENKIFFKKNNKNFRAGACTLKTKKIKCLWTIQFTKWPNKVPYLFPCRAPRLESRSSNIWLHKQCDHMSNIFFQYIAIHNYKRSNGQFLWSTRRSKFESSFDLHFFIEKNENKRKKAVVVVKWSECSPSIWRYEFEFRFNLQFLLRRTKINEKDRVNKVFKTILR